MLYWASENTILGCRNWEMYKLKHERKYNHVHVRENTHMDMIHSFFFSYFPLSKFCPNGITSKDFNKNIHIVKSFKEYYTIFSLIGVVFIGCF